MRMRNRRAARPITLMGGALLAASVLAPISAAGIEEDPCDLPEGQLTPQLLPEGASVIDCDAVGRTVVVDGAAFVIPDPGLAVGSTAIMGEGAPESATVQIEVSPDGEISYTQEAESGVQIAGASPEACSDASYSVNDLKEYGTYDWYVGDGGMPGALSQSEAASAFRDAIDNITGSYNNCGIADTVYASSSFKGNTTYEADISATGTCTARDGKSTWDAGDLPSGTVAKSCWWSIWMPGVKNDLIEADVRYNTADYDFTDSISGSCYHKFDVRGVGTHEAGHVYGLGHVADGHANLTMYIQSFYCSAAARTLGKGDVLGLQSIY